MILKTISINNFRKFKDAFIEFPDGVTGVVGLNGVGKSTLFEAFAWGLYGPVAARTGLDQIKRQDAPTSEPCRVEIEFVFDEDAYRVVREMSGKNLSTSAIATVNGKIAANGAELVTKFIQRKLGMDWKSFYTSIFAKQKELNTLSSMNPSERRQLILRMLGINIIDKIISDIRSDTKDKKNLIEKMELDLLDSNGKEKLTIFQQELEHLEKSKKDLEKQNEDQKKIYQTIEIEFNKIKKDYDAKKQTYEKICRTKEQLEEKKNKFEKIQSIVDNIKTLEKTLHERQENLKELTKKLSIYKNLEKELKTFKQHQEKNHDSIQTVIKKKEHNKTLMYHLEKDIKELTIKKQNIEQIGPNAKCPTCERILGVQHKRLLEIYSEELQKKSHKNQKLIETKKSLDIEYERLSREKQALHKKNIFLHTQVVERERLQAILQSISKEIQREKNKLEIKRKEIKSIGLIEFNQKKYFIIRTSINNAYNNYQTSLAKLNEIKEKHQEIRLKQKEHEGEKNLINQKIKTIEKNIDEQKTLRKNLEDEQHDTQSLTTLSEIMDSYRIYLISQIRPTLSTYASELFHNLTDGKYSEIELDEDYNILVYDQGQPYSIKRFSGGEEDLVNLCIRMAISEIITKSAGSILNFIVLDEIFGSQDQIRKHNIIKALNSFSSKFHQIFLITHIEDIKHYTEHTMTVVESENGISSIRLE